MDLRRFWRFCTSLKPYLKYELLPDVLALQKAMPKPSYLWRSALTEGKIEICSVAYISICRYVTVKLININKCIYHLKRKVVYRLQSATSRTGIVSFRSISHLHVHMIALIVSFSTVTLRILLFFQSSYLLFYLPGMNVAFVVVGFWRVALVIPQFGSGICRLRRPITPAKVTQFYYDIRTVGVYQFIIIIHVHVHSSDQNPVVYHLALNLHRRSTYAFTCTGRLLHVQINRI